MTPDTRNFALIVAAGRGRRFGGERPKQYAELAGKPLLRHSVEACLDSGLLSGVRVVIGADDSADYRLAVLGLEGLLDPVEGGETRQDSVRLGLESLAEHAPERVLIHDAARPGLDRQTIRRVLEALDEAPGAIPALPVTDTLKRAGANGRIEATVPRQELFRAQTPQGFRYAEILRAHELARGQDLTDDAAVLEAAGLAAALVEGSARLEKITTNEDLARMNHLWRESLETRVGQGLDVHAFGEGRALMLCGVPLDHDQSLIGHSDADVGLHAITDAILGALSEGDIGQHFPPQDPRWRGADSAQFLAHAGALVKARGGIVRHIDVTLICEAPRVGPHRQAMIRRIAEILGLEDRRISVKATTTERLGFLGRREGIAAEAIATLALPP